MDKDIKVGEYIRTKQGEIYIITDLEDYGLKIDEFYNQIKNHSFNIIDLIEEGDYVNGEPVEKNRYNAR